MPTFLPEILLKAACPFCKREKGLQPAIIHNLWCFVMENPLSLMTMLWQGSMDLFAAATMHIFVLPS